MKSKWGKSLTTAALMGGTAAAYLALTAQTPKAETTKGQAELEARGKYLVTIMGCGDCHSPYGPDAKPIPGREFSGHPENAPLPTWDPSMLEKGNLATIAPTFTAFAGPFGLAVAGNITPDMETGIGTLTAEGLIKSWRTGKHWKQDRMVLPPMPMEPYSHLTDADIRAIHAYLFTLKPVKNNFPASKPAGPPHK
jgi:cytochrome c553